jgi:hypothetical protein
MFSKEIRNATKISSDEFLSEVPFAPEDRARYAGEDGAFGP